MVFVVVVWFTAAMIMLDTKAHRPAAKSAAVAVASEERRPSAAGVGDDVYNDDQHLLITDVVKALIMYAQVSDDGRNNGVTILVGWQACL